MRFDPETQTIIYEADEAIVARPLSFAANGKYCAVKATYSNLVKLTELDLETPDPLNGYAFPSLPGTEPFETQRQVTSFMVLNPRSFILSDLRTGKTRAALWAADWLMGHAKKRLSCLILSDITALEATWAVEITTHFLGRRSYELLFGTAEARVAALAREADFYLLNHDALRIGRPRRIVEKDKKGQPLSVRAVPAGSLYKALIEKNFDIVVADEAATYREHRTEMARAAAAISRHAAYVWLLTGTPAPNGTPLDAYGLKRLCHPQHRLTFSAWREATTVPNGPFRREPKPESEALVDELLSPAIRIRQDQCFAATPLIGPVDVHCPLSDEQIRHMKELKRELVLLLDGGAEITAVNEAALRAKMLQISCIGRDTPVLTDSGWKPIQEVMLKDKIWDGVGFVVHNGVLCKGIQSVIDYSGVLMTPEHKILTPSGWSSAMDLLHDKSGFKFNRQPVWLPYSHKKSWNDYWNKRTIRNMGMLVRLWQHSHKKEPISSSKASGSSEKLWLPQWQRNSQDVKYSAASHLDSYAPALSRRDTSRLAKLWGAWNNCVRVMEQFVFGILARYENLLRSKINSWQNRQQSWLLQTELPLGDGYPASKQYTDQQAYSYSNRGAVCCRGGRYLWIKENYAVCTNKQGVGWEQINKPDKTTFKETFDIINCGPRNRFVVRGKENQLLIVHNCGVVYDEDHSPHLIDAGPRLRRLKQLVAALPGKMLIFAPLTSVVRMLAAELGETATEIVSTQTKRAKLAALRAWQHNPLKRAVVSHPGPIARGIDLSAASSVIWYTPCDRTEQYGQANERINGINQRSTRRIIRLSGNSLETDIYNRLERNLSLQGAILKLKEII